MPVLRVWRLRFNCETSFDFSLEQNQGNIHLFLANPDGPWRHSNKDLDPTKIIISKRRDHRVKEKIQDILEEMIDSVIDTVSPPEIISEGSDIDEGNSGTDDEEMSSGDEESEDSEDTKAFKELLPSLTCQTIQTSSAMRGSSTVQVVLVGLSIARLIPAAKKSTPMQQLCAIIS